MERGSLLKKTKSDYKHTNRLIHEISPYLHQHAHNPVDWYPWGDEALKRAREEDKIIFLSIGYAACHWCHVMAHETFENEDIAAFMNAHFINIKVDREERQDLDAIYMEAVQALTGGGGWPLSVWLLPNGKPFYGGTYFPPTARGGMPGFRQVLEAVMELYENDRERLLTIGNQLQESLQKESMVTSASEELDPIMLNNAVRTLSERFDSEFGGFGSAPKFPQSPVLKFLLRYSWHMKDERALEMSLHTLRKMANGGIYDQLGGGFHRYAVDAQWLVPHFEKMLYDNALLVQVYLEAWQITHEPLFRKVVEETLGYVLREMTDPEGGFYSSQDADSAGGEGAYFLWRFDELETVLGRDEARLFGTYFGATKRGNFEGKNILHVTNDIKEVASELGVSVETLEGVIIRGKEKLFTVREKRVKPARDEKILTGWNALMQSAFANAGIVLERDDFIEAAVKNANFLQQELLRDDGKVFHVWAPASLTNGVSIAKLDAFLDDYVYLVKAYLDVYRLTMEIRWLRKARSLLDKTIELFWDSESGGFYQTGCDHEKLIARQKDFFDKAIPSGNAVAAAVCWQLEKLTGNNEYLDFAVKILQIVGNSLGKYPTAFGTLLNVLEGMEYPSTEVAVIGRRDNEITQRMFRIIRERYLPDLIVAWAGDDLQAESLSFELPLLKGRNMIEGRTTAYVCENYTCRLPVTDIPALQAQLDSLNIARGK